VEVISVTASNGYDANTGEQETNKDEKELPSTVTLMVTPEQGNLLASLESDGKTHLSLVYRGEESKVKKFLEMQSKVLDQLYPKQQTIINQPTDGTKESVEQVTTVAPNNANTGGGEE
jgi:pilus assembly protein CpaB